VKKTVQRGVDKEIIREEAKETLRRGLDIKI